MVVVRRVEDDGGLWIASDARSDKGTQFRERPGAEVVFWLANLREQFRIAGAVEIANLSDPSRPTLWRELSDSARSLFLWPTPGKLRGPEDSRFPERVSAQTEMPETFDLLILLPDRSERLQLGEHPHLRTRWDARSNWEAEILNP